MEQDQGTPFVGHSAVVARQSSEEAPPGIVASIAHQERTPAWRDANSRGASPNGACWGYRRAQLAMGDDLEVLGRHCERS